MALLLTLAIHHEHDVVTVRQRARTIAEQLGFDGIEQTRIATAVSEVARNAFMYATGGSVTYRLEGDTPPQLLVIVVSDRGPGIANLDAVLDGTYQSPTGMGIGLSGARRLVDRFHIDSTREGTTVTLAKLLPARARRHTDADVRTITQALGRQGTDGALGEIQQQNQELLSALAALRSRQDDLERVNRELEDTNRGVVALYAELDERADHLRRADEVKTRFLSNMSHEFRTPLNSILALTRLLRERLQVDPEEKGELYYIHRSAQQLSDLVDDLLDIAKVEAGKIEVRPAQFDVRNLFGALRGMLRPLLAGQSLALTFDDPADVPLLYSDETKVSQILRNFISNAIKYTEQGEIRVGVTVRPETGRIEFSVADTGIGIPESDLPRIFDEFVQIENPLQRRAKGTGLGLPLSRRLADLLGGDIRVESTLGQGSTFTLSIPLTYHAPGPEPLAPVLESVPADRLPILVVEDGEQDLLLYQRLFANSPFHMVAVRSPDAALRAVAAIAPAALVVDIRLRSQDEWDLMLQLRRATGRDDLPVVVVSTLDDERKAFGLGADAFGAKPIDPAWLLRTLHRLVSPGSAVKVLAVDDEESYRFLIREMLDDPTYQLTEAESGEQAIALAPHVRPDVILLDVQLTGIDGIETAVRLSETQATAGVPMVIVTSRESLGPGETRRLPARTRILPKSGLSRAGLRRVIRDAVMVCPRPAA